MACAGLWDRGKHVRERWREPTTGRELLIEPTALLDLGCAAGEEAALADLLRWCVGRTHELGRTHLLAPLQWLPEVGDRLTDLEPAAEAWGLIWRGRVPVERAYTDLIFW